MFFVKPLVAFGGHHHLNLRHGIGPGTAGLGNTNVRDVAALTAGGKDGELVVLALVKSEVIKTPGRDAAGAVKVLMLARRRGWLPEMTAVTWSLRNMKSPMMPSASFPSGN